jgi:Mg2+ and Co2+ transporter CorA
MVRALIELGETEDRVVTIVKGKYGLKTKSDAINLIIEKYREEVLEPHLRPEFAKRLGELTKETGKRYSSIDELRKDYA